jgi:hypothetical protein
MIRPRRAAESHRGFAAFGQLPRGTVFILEVGDCRKRHDRGNRKIAATPWPRFSNGKQGRISFARGSG